MTAQFARDDVSYTATTNFSATAPSVFAPATSNPVAGFARGIANWLSSQIQRRAVIEELSMLSDHELADIGLTRGDIPHVLDRGFVTAHSRLNAARS